MAKQAFPGVQTGGGALPKALTILALVGFAMFAFKQPAEAANVVLSVLDGLGQATEAIMTFFQALS